MSQHQLSSSLLERLWAFDSPTISNTVEHFRLRDQMTGYATKELVCQFPDLKPMVSFALTCTADTTRPVMIGPLVLTNFLTLLRRPPGPVLL